MDRRDFLKCAAVTGCGLIMGDTLNSFLNPVYASEKIDLVVAKGPGKSPSAVTKAAIDAFGGIRKFVLRGDIVVVKPNIGWDRLPEQAANTKPEVVATIV
ncbi:MAG: twin-arginine translocation signal domain-containing protein, partial [Syntrophales bacterium LBB04]|nr:twin-arginine translocation signal domain-containing protein [Syntrophales bacterium LBB04]